VNRSPVSTLGNIRWVGPEGYQGIVARQMQEFKERQKARAAAAQEAVLQEG
jgi:hypothetical protein